MNAFTSQKTATRVWKAFEKYMFDKDIKKVSFKQKGEMISVEGKTKGEGIRFNEDQLFWNGLNQPYSFVWSFRKILSLFHSLRVRFSC